MAHFAQIDENNTVLRVVVINNSELLDGDGVEQETIGRDFCRTLFSGTWVQTSYNGKIRKNFASGGYTYDVARDAFYGPKPYPSWTLNDDSCLWEAPTAYPDNGEVYIWDEDTRSWVVDSFS